MSSEIEVWAVPGQNSIIDEIDVNGLTKVYGKDAAAVLADEPAAVRMTWEAWRAAAVARQNAIAIAWEPSTQEQYDEMLNVLPPIDFDGYSFLVGEPSDHSFETGRPRFAAYRFIDDRYEVASRPLTRAELREHRLRR